VLLVPQVDLLSIPLADLALAPVLVLDRYSSFWLAG